MFSLFLLFSLLVLSLQRETIVAATTAITFYTDHGCNGGSITVETDTRAGNGSVVRSMAPTASLHRWSVTATSVTSLLVLASIWDNLTNIGSRVRVLGFILF